MGEGTAGLDETTDLHAVQTARSQRETAPMRPVRSARIVCVAGPDLGRSFSIGSEPLVLGRSSKANAMLRAHDVSRWHARMVPSASGFTVEDLGSANGTFVNEMPVAGPTLIAIGDRVQLGHSTIFVLAYHDELEARMRKLQRLEALEQAVGGLAHDFNNMLTVIAAGLSFLSRRLPSDDAELAGALQEMFDASENASALARKILDLRRHTESGSSVFPLAPVVDEVVAMFKRVATAKVEVEVEVPPELAVRAVRDELVQVLLNLALNARDAMPDGGTLAFRASVSRGGAYTELAVADTGVGMDETTLSRVFEPFFTTKPPGRGTGLGLAMAHNIVRRAGGAIEVASVVGTGTTFRIWLPAT